MDLYDFDIFNSSFVREVISQLVINKFRFSYVKVMEIDVILLLDGSEHRLIDHFYIDDGDPTELIDSVIEVIDYHYDYFKLLIDIESDVSLLIKYCINPV